MELNYYQIEKMRNDKEKFKCANYTQALHMAGFFRHSNLIEVQGKSVFYIVEQ